MDTEQIVERIEKIRKVMDGKLADMKEWEGMSKDYYHGFYDALEVVIGIFGEGEE